MSLPTYEEAVAGPTVWSLVGENVDSSDLAALSLVNSQFNTTFAPLLWNDPIKFVACRSFPFSRAISFMNRARMANQNTRDLILHLDFRPLLPLRSSILPDYVKHEHTISVTWVLSHVTFFKNLRFVVVDGLRMLNENDPYPRNPQGTREVVGPHVFLFSGSDVYSMDTTFITTTGYLVNVMFLDLSFTTRTERWTRTISSIALGNLRILKLRGLRLTDQNLPDCVLRSDCRLWSLDLRDNFLTDQTIESLLRSCFLLPITQPTHLGPTNDDDFLYENTPKYEIIPSHRVPSDTNCALRPDDKDGFAAYLKKHAHLTVHDRHPLAEGAEEVAQDPLIRSTGLTHLYLSNNKFTSLGIRRLLRTTNRLQVVDVGSVRSLPTHTFHIPFTTAYAQADTVTPLLRPSGTRLESIRVHHSVITQVPTILPSDGESEYTLPSLKHAETVFGPRQKAVWVAFSPLGNYRISSVTLTDVPTKSFGMIVDSLLLFLGHCAKQERRLEGARAAGIDHRRAPQLLTGVRKLRLEFVPKSRIDPVSPFASVSGDRDADEFLAQSSGDFSFFGGDEAMSRSKSNGGASSSSSRPSTSSSGGPYANVRDVIEELKAWRLTDEGRGWTGKLELMRPRGNEVKFREGRDQ